LNEVENHLRVSPRAIWRIVDGEAVILALDGGHYFGLNGVGTRIWMLLHEGLSEAAICAQVFQEFDAERAELEADVAGFLQDLIAKGLVESENEPAASS
jgi:hypothetical protein